MNNRGAGNKAPLKVSRYVDRCLLLANILPTVCCIFQQHRKFSNIAKQQHHENGICSRSCLKSAQNRKHTYHRGNSGSFMQAARVGKVKRRVARFNGFQVLEVRVEPGSKPVMCASGGVYESLHY